MEKNKIVALCYDFDKTLSPFNMQEQGFIQDLGLDINVFWEEVKDFSTKNQVEGNLAYMYKMVQKVGKSFTKETLKKYGEKIKLFDGVDGWFDRINAYALGLGIKVEHYIISSGIKEMIEGTNIAKNGCLKEIYASSFYYDENGVAVWPSQVVNYTNKTQFLFRIEKGVLDALDDAVNDKFMPDEKRIPFSNIIYIGDSDTDVPCMSLVKRLGGNSIGVYNKETLDKSKIIKMIKDERISSFAPADYTENSELDKTIKNILKQI